MAETLEGEEMQLGEVGECRACELLVQYCRAGKVNELPKSLTNNALLGRIDGHEVFLDFVGSERAAPLSQTGASPAAGGQPPGRREEEEEEEETPGSTPTKDGADPQDGRDSDNQEAEKAGGGEAEGVGDQGTEGEREGSPESAAGLETARTQEAAGTSPPPGGEVDPPLDLDELEFSADTKSLLRRKRALDAAIKGTLPGGADGERNNSSRGPTFPKKRTLVHRMARELDEKVRLGLYSFLAGRESAACHIRNYLLAVGQETEVAAQAKQLMGPQAGHAHLQQQQRPTLSGSAHCPGGHAHLNNSHAQNGISPIPSAPLIDAHATEGPVLVQGDNPGFDPRGRWNRTSSEESTASEELDRGRVRRRSSRRESGDMSSPGPGDPAAQEAGLGKGRLSELLRFYEKLEEEAIKSGHRTTLCRQTPHPCGGGAKKWKKRSRSCAPKLSPPGGNLAATGTGGQGGEQPPRALTAEDAELCKALERMVGDSEVDKSMRAAFLSVIQEIQDQTQAATPSQDSSEPEQFMDLEEAKRKRVPQFAILRVEPSSTDKRHKKIKIQEEGAGGQAAGCCQQEQEQEQEEVWMDPDQMEGLPTQEGQAAASAAEAAPTSAGAALFHSLAEELSIKGDNAASGPVPRHRGDHMTRLKIERVSKLISFVIVLLGLVAYVSKFPWPFAQLLK